MEGVFRSMLKVGPILPLDPNVNIDKINAHYRLTDAHKLLEKCCPELADILVDKVLDPFHMTLSKQELASITQSYKYWGK